MTNPISFHLMTFLNTIQKLHQLEEKNLTSLPVPASMSKNMSTSERTSFAALALLTIPKKGRTNLINPASSATKSPGQLTLCTTFLFVILLPTDLTKGHHSANEGTPL